MNDWLTLESANSAAVSMLAWLGQAVLFGSVLAPLTWLVLRVLRRRVSPGIDVALWAIVLVKFIVPLGPEFSYSLGTLYQTIGRHAPPGTGWKALSWVVKNRSWIGAWPAVGSTTRRCAAPALANHFGGCVSGGRLQPVRVALGKL